MTRPRDTTPEELEEEMEHARIEFERWRRAKKCSTPYELTQEDEDWLNDPRHEEKR